MNVTLAPELEHIVIQKLASGVYSSAGEVIREALLLLQEQDELMEYRLEELRQAVAVGLQQLRNGEGIPGEQVFAELQRLSQQRRQPN